MLPSLDPAFQVDFRERVKEVLNFRIWPSTGEDDVLETAATSGAEAALKLTALRPEHPAAAALREGGHAELSFGFSAGGLLFPYYIGVIFRLHELGIVTRASHPMMRQLSEPDVPDSQGCSAHVRVAQYAVSSGGPCWGDGCLAVHAVHTKISIMAFIDVLRMLATKI